MDSPTLTAKQQNFIDEYLQCWNATEAAIKAKYSEKTARQTGSENLSKPYIAAEIQRRIKERAMTADEALYRLAEQARGDIGDFVTIHGGLPHFDLDKAKKAGKLFLIKRLKVTDRSLDIELYDAQSALTTILKELHLSSGEVTERYEISGLPPLPDDQLDNIFS